MLVLLESLEDFDAEKVLLFAIGFVGVKEAVLFDVGASDFVDRVSWVDKEELFDVFFIDGVFEILDVDSFSDALVSCDLSVAVKEVSFKADEEPDAIDAFDNCLPFMIHPLFPCNKDFVLIQYFFYLVECISNAVNHSIFL